MLLCSWKRQGKGKRGPSILLPNALKEAWMPAWDERALLLQPQAFPLLSTTCHSMERHFWQLPAPGSHPCTAFWEQSTEPATTGATAMARAGTMLVVMRLQHHQKGATANQKRKQTEIFWFWPRSTKSCWFWATSMSYSSCTAKAQAAEVAADFCG